MHVYMLVYMYISQSSLSLYILPQEEWAPSHDEWESALAETARGGEALEKRELHHGTRDLEIWGYVLGDVHGAWDSFVRGGRRKWSLGLCTGR